MNDVIIDGGGDVIAGGVRGLTSMKVGMVLDAVYLGDG